MKYWYFVRTVLIYAAGGPLLGLLGVALLVAALKPDSSMLSFLHVGSANMAAMMLLATYALGIIPAVTSGVLQAALYWHGEGRDRFLSRRQSALAGLLGGGLCAALFHALMTLFLASTPHWEEVWIYLVPGMFSGALLGALTAPGPRAAREKKAAAA